MFRASLCPSSGEQDRVLPHMVFCTGCAGCGCVELGLEPCAQSNSNLHTMHTAYDPAPHNHSQHNQCRTPYAVVHSLILLMMGIMMLETCWDGSLIINIWLVASRWFFSLSSHYVHDARSQEPKIEYICNFSENTSLSPKFVTRVAYILILDLSHALLSSSLGQFAVSVFT